MNMWLRFWIYWALLTFGFWLWYPAYGQTATTNLINPAGTAWGIPSAQVLNSAGILAVEGGGVYIPGSPYYNSDTNTIRFSYLPGTVAQSIAINSALAGTGIKWLGYDYSWQIQNAPGQNGGQLSATISLIGNNGKALESYFYNYPQGITPQAVWLADSGRKLFSPTGGYTSGQVSSLDVTWSGKDSLFWMGLFGPRVRDTDIRLLYGVDQCVANPLSDPTCPGYAQALLTQQCSANPLSDPACPGYAQALLTQQCAANPLSSSTCPGYQQALVLQQQQAQQTAVAAATPSATTVSVTGTVSTTEPTISIATDGTVTTGVATVPQAEVNAVVTRQIPSTASPTGTVTLQVQTQPAKEADEKKQLRAATDAERELALKEEKKREEEASERRRDLAARMRAAAQEAAVSRGREAIKQAESAQTMEQQMVNQNLIVATMNFVPGFETYGLARLPDVQGYAPREIYRGQQTVDNRRLLRGLTGASDQRHTDMVNSQYEK